MPGPDAGRPVFVLHEHDRPRHHFDLRLEEDGVLRSWAVPKGLPDDPATDRLAVSVADHELEHATYIDDDKRIADTGWWELEDRTDKRFVFVLHGRTQAVRYALIDTGSDWLLHRVRRQPWAGSGLLDLGAPDERRADDQGQDRTWSRERSQTGSTPETRSGGPAGGL